MSSQSDGLTYHCSELVSALYEDRFLNTRPLTANLEAISAGSATLLSDERLQAGRPIAFSVKGHDLYGVIESVDVDQTLGCYAKVKLDPMHRWHKQLFLPDHFLALCQSTQHAGGNSVDEKTKSFTLSRR